MEANLSPQDLERATKRSLEWSKLILWPMLLLTFLGVLGLSLIVLLQPPPASFLRQSIETPIVYPTGQAVSARSIGSVRMRAWIDSPLDPECLISTQYFVEFSDKSMAKLPGMRITTQGEIKESLYEVAVPQRSPEGQAYFFIRDIYNCGIQARQIQSERLPFMISSGTPNGRS